MIYFCTYCDSGYAARLLCLYESLVGQGEPFRLYVLCFDVETERIVREQDDESLSVISLSALLEADSEFAAARARRSPVEFFFTATPVLLRYCLRVATEPVLMTYLDADLCFFGPSSRVLEVQGGASVGIVAHRFPERLAERKVYGTYNVAWVSIRRDAAGLACLDWWRDRCLEWCHDYVDQGRFADQGYLDEFPRRFSGVTVLDHPGINAAPWNVAGSRITSRGDQVLIDDEPLLFYHFQGVRAVGPMWFEPGLRAYGSPLTRELRELIYAPYLSRLVAVERRLVDVGLLRPRLKHSRLNRGSSWRDRWERVKRRWLLPYYGRLAGRLIHVTPSATGEKQNGTGRQL